MGLQLVGDDKIVSEIEEKSIEIMQCENRETKCLKKNEQSSRDLYDNIK